MKKQVTVLCPDNPGKISYPNQEKALRRRKSMERRFPEHFWSHYKCSCGAWHIGKPSGRYLRLRQEQYEVEREQKELSDAVKAWENDGGSYWKGV